MVHKQKDHLLETRPVLIRIKNSRTIRTTAFEKQATSASCRNPSPPAHRASIQRRELSFVRCTGGAHRLWACTVCHFSSIRLLFYETRPILSLFRLSLWTFKQLVSIFPTPQVPRLFKLPKSRTHRIPSLLTDSSEALNAISPTGWKGDHQDK